MYFNTSVNLHIFTGVELQSSSADTDDFTVDGLRLIGSDLRFEFLQHHDYREIEICATDDQDYELPEEFTLILKPDDGVSNGQIGFVDRLTVTIISEDCKLLFNPCLCCTIRKILQFSTTYFFETPGISQPL